MRYIPPIYTVRNHIISVKNPEDMEPLVWVGARRALPRLARLCTPSIDASLSSSILNCKSPLVTRMSGGFVLLVALHLQGFQ